MGILKALVYACGNCLVCETLDEARRLCYGGSGRSGGAKHKVVTLDGSVIHKSGNLTGGIGDFHKKAKRWDEKNLAKVRHQRDKWYKEMVELERTHRSRDQAQQILTEIKGLENRLRYSEMDLKVTTSKMQKGEREIRAIDQDIAGKRPGMKKLKEILKRKEKEMDKLKESIRRVEIDLFQDFSDKVGVKNIAEFEENRLVEAQKRLERMSELANQQSRLRNQIEYERSRVVSDKLKNVQKKLTNERSKLR